MLDGFIAVAATQSKHICYLQSSSHLAPSQVASDSAATLPWLPSLYADIAPTGPRDAAADLSGQLVAGAPVTTTIAATGDGEAPPELPPDPVVGRPTGTGLLLVHTSTPKPSGSSWTEVRCGRKGDPAVGSGSHSSPCRRYSTSSYGRWQHSRSLRCVSSSCGGRHLSCNTAVSSPPAAAPPPLPAPSAGRTARRSTMGNSRHRMLQEAVIRRSGGLPWAGPPPSSPEPPSPTEAVEVERPATCATGPHTPPPHPLFPPTTLIIGDSITRDIRFINAITHCFPGATVRFIHDKLLDILPSLPTSVTKIVVHVGCNNTSQSERTIADFNLLFNVLKNCGKSVFITGPLPQFGRGSERFSRMLYLHTRLQSTCSSHNMDFIDNFNLFWDCADLFSRDGIHPSPQGNQMLRSNIQYAVQSSTRA
ncbi:hypothetical protein ABVT39_016513 [Epinephelus coioides]